MHATLHLLSASSGAHPPGWWLAKSGKLLLLLAGLAIVLDLLGHERLRRVHEWATRRRELVVDIRTAVRHGRTVEQLAASVLGEPITHGPLLSVTGGSPGAIVHGYRHSTAAPAAIPPLLSAADVAKFAEHTAARLPTEHSCTGRHDDDICFGQARFIEAEAAREVIDRLAVSERARSVVMGHYRRSRTDSDVGGYIVGGVLAGSLVVLGLAVVGRIPAAVAWVAVIVSLVVALAFEVTRIRIGIYVHLTATPVRVLSSWGLAMLGRRANGNPVKWTALILFVFGSLLDLIWG